MSVLGQRLGKQDVSGRRGAETEQANQAPPGTEIVPVLNIDVKNLEKGKSCMSESGV